MCRRELTCLTCLTILSASPVAAQLQIPTSFRIGPYGAMTTSPFLDPAAGVRTLVSFASDLEFQVDQGVRRPRVIGSNGSIVGTTTGSLQYNAFGGYPHMQIGFFAGYQLFYGAESGGEIDAGLAFGTSHARGEHLQYEPSLGLRFSGGHHRLLFQFKMVAIRLPSFVGHVPKSPPFDLRVDSVDAGGVPSNPSWTGGKGTDADRSCRFSYVQTSSTPFLVYRPECFSTDQPTLNQPISMQQAKHSGLTCSVRDAEPIIRGHINWRVVSQTGRLRWGDYSGGIGDHDFDLFVEAPQLVTRGNIKANGSDRAVQHDSLRDSLIEIEFDGDETVAHFDTRLGGIYWKSLIDLTRAAEGTPAYLAANRDADMLFRKRRGVVIGLLGLDGEHDFHTELHPVLAFAVDVSHMVNDRFQEASLVLMRNMGDEGECSSGRVTWVNPDSTRYVVQLPWKAGADSVVVDSSRFGFIARRDVTLLMEVDSGRAIRLIADLPRPIATDSAATVYGTLWLRWLTGGRPLAHDTIVPFSGDVLVPRVRQERGFERPDTTHYSTGRRLCLAPRREVVHRTPSPSLPLLTVPRDSSRAAPAVHDTLKCSS